MEEKQNIKQNPRKAYLGYYEVCCRFKTNEGSRT